MKGTNYSKQIDDLGRVLIPKKLRQELSLVAGDELDMYLYDDSDGTRYLCFKLPNKQREKLLQAKELLAELKIPFPDELKSL